MSLWPGPCYTLPFFISLTRVMTCWTHERACGNHPRRFTWAERGKLQQSWLCETCSDTLWHLLPAVQGWAWVGSSCPVEMRAPPPFPIDLSNGAPLAPSLYNTIMGTDHMSMGTHNQLTTQSVLPVPSPPIALPFIHHTNRSLEMSMKPL